MPCSRYDEGPNFREILRELGPCKWRYRWDLNPNRGPVVIAREASIRGILPQFRGCSITASTHNRPHLLPFCCQASAER